ncbi:MAG: MlaD family protein [Gammaproteobacteria bacterium]|nr:MlaD family protein [Gammaproteobacteria bacterium]
MESKANNLLVGSFVIIFVIGLVGFIFWLEDFRSMDDDVLYKVYFEESVAGLSRSASVKYRGVHIGIVESIRINPSNSEEIELLLKVKKEAPVKTDSVAVLKFHGLTGLAFIELEGGSKTSPRLRPQAGEVPVIESAPSTFGKLNDSLPDIAISLLEALNRINTLLSNENLSNYNALIENAVEITASIKGYEDELDTLLANGLIMEKKAIASLDKTANAADEIGQAAQAFNNSLQRGDYNLKAMSAPAREQADALLDRLNALSLQMEQTLSDIQRSPRDLFFKQTAPRPGPGESSENE